MGYTKQGEPLPEITGCEGEWIRGEDLFLFIGKDDEAIRSFKLANSRECLGFNARSIAKELGISPDDLMQLNRDLDLTADFHEALSENMAHHSTLFRLTTSQGSVEIVVDHTFVRGRA
jgi:hypothetical protein